MHLKIQGLVVRATQYSDHDLLLTLLTSQQGKITVKARGARKKNSRLVACCQLLAYCEYTLFEYHGMFTINEAEPIELFAPIHKDIEKLALATYFVQVAEVISQEDMPTGDLLPLVLNSLYVLGQGNVPAVQIKGVFEMRAALLAGYEPDLRGCHRCGNEFPDRFDISEGRLECSRCREPGSDGIRMPVSIGCLDAIRYICNCDPKKIFSFQLSEENVRKLSQLAESYISTQLERGFSALDFYKSLMIENADFSNN